MTRWIIGIDEAGRGPLAGPVAVGAVMVPADFDFILVKGVRDSKKLTAAARERWYREIVRLGQTSALQHAVSFSSASVIDERGIVFAIRRALERCLARFDVNPAECDVRLDGSLSAPRTFTRQQTIIGGDDKEPVISLASVAAKVRRDRLMGRVGRAYPGYGFEQHKGYGTEAHYEAIGARGLVPLVHRATFISSV